MEMEDFDDWLGGESADEGGASEGSGSSEESDGGSESGGEDGEADEDPTPGGKRKRAAPPPKPRKKPDARKRHGRVEIEYETELPQREVLLA